MYSKPIISILRLISLAIGISCVGYLAAQEVVQVGAGSYASYMPLSAGRTDAHTGDQSIVMQTRKLRVTERQGQPIPTNDWWTGLINAQFAQALWSYPAMVYPEATGVTVTYPSYWNENGTEVKWRTSLTVMSKKFQAVESIADSWHDWDVEMLQRNAEGTSQMLTTLVHGTPFTWIETTGLESLTIKPSAAAVLFDETGNDIPESALSEGGYTSIGLQVDDDLYGVYLPAGVSLAMKQGSLAVDGVSSEGSYVVVALLTSASELATNADYAYNIPRNTSVSWAYDERNGIISSTWKVDAVNLNTGDTGVDVLQGFIPHAYKSAIKKPSFRTETYLTPRGTMKLSSGREFDFSYKFSGMLPWYATPEVNQASNPLYDPAVLNELINTYATEGAFGADTYWGGKGLVQMALNMTFALQTGNTEVYELSKKKLKDVLINWLTYTPGEERYYFAFYPRWGGLVGQDTSYDSDTFNDHHFHYGYFTLAGAMLCLVDDEFKSQYGEMLKLLAKDYANWDRNDNRFPFLRNMDPWVGHSYAGGMGDNGNYNGNGQESSSESMQGWGGVYLLGVALGDKEMRDAGIFGWSTEARATREYWFDVDSRYPNPLFDPEGHGGYIDYSLYSNPYNSNITCKGIGWWTWFGGDPLYMHGIQWMPISPALDYLSWDKDFVNWAYNDMMESHGWVHKWFENGTNPEGGSVDPLANNDWGNVTLAYLQRANPQLAAEIFDTAYKQGSHIASSVSTSHISYYVTHHHLTYGDIDWTVNADIPTANAYVDADGNYTYMVYNPDSERNVTFYRDGAVVKTVRAPRGKLVAVSDEAVADMIELSLTPARRFPSSATAVATVYDQYGATIENAKVQWSVSDTSIATVNNEGIVNFSASAADGATVMLTATCGSAVSTIELIKGAVPVVDKMSITPKIEIVEVGNPVNFSAKLTDQYGETSEASVEWYINGNKVDTPRVDGTTPGRYTVKAVSGSASVEHTVVVVPSLPNIALNKPVVASSEENVGTVHTSATDGDITTRWGSRATDDEWIYVDLGEDCHITRVDLVWEAAYSSRYLLQVAAEGAATEKFTALYHDGNEVLDVVSENEWLTIADISGIANSGKQSHSVDAVGRYVRVKNIVRGSQYGISLYEFGVGGVSLSAGENDIVGIDITAPNPTVDENGSLQFSATAYTLLGEKKDVEVKWQASQGTITAGGLFSPATYGTATITATTAEGLSSSRDVIVNEVVHLASLSVTPSTVKLAVGETARFEIEAVDQFGGIYETEAEPLVSVVDADGNPAQSQLSIDISAGTIRATTIGSYSVTISIGDVNTTFMVEVVPFTDVNLALNRQATAGSGANANVSCDGDATTRWQAKPGAAQWWQVELDDLYNVNRFKVLWEASYAKSYHIEISVDGDTFFPVAYSAESPSTSALTQELTIATAVPARYVRLVADDLSDTAVTYGISFFELEVYGESRAEASSPMSPIINTAEILVSGVDANIEINAEDDTHILYYTIRIDEQSVISPMTVAEQLIGSSGETLTSKIVNLKPGVSYVATVVATDVAGNSASVNREFATEMVDYSSVNLALQRPVVVSSHENASTVGTNAVDGKLETRWGSGFNDGESLEIDLEAVYRVTQIRIYVNDAAYAKNATIEYSIDGTDWTELTSVNRSTVGTWDEISVNGTPMRYIRYTGVTRSMNYGISVHEFEVYGDAKMLGIASTDGSHVKLEGLWDKQLFENLDDAATTVYDLTAVSGLTNVSEIGALNPNCMLFVPSAVDGTTNVVHRNGEEYLAAEIDFVEGYDFSTPVDIAVNGDITFHAAEAKNQRTLILPFDYKPESDKLAYIFDNVSDNVVTFSRIAEAGANQPMLLTSGTPINEIAVTGSKLYATTNVDELGARSAAVGHFGTYSSRTLAGVEHQFESSTMTLEPVADGDEVKSFCTYFVMPEGDTYSVTLSETSSAFIDSQLLDNKLVNVYTLKGIILKEKVPATEALQGLTPGFYIIGPHLIYIK